MSRETSTFYARAVGLLRRLPVPLSLCAAQALAQEAGKAPQGAEQDEEVVTVRSQLVNIDVVVRDGKGKGVTDLKAEDFVVVEDGANAFKKLAVLAAAAFAVLCTVGPPRAASYTNLSARRPAPL
jgi:hypothetical protein